MTEIKIEKEKTGCHGYCGPRIHRTALLAFYFYDRKRRVPAFGSDSFQEAPVTYLKSLYY